MYRISKDFHFSAAHWLNDLPDSHPCARLHGHNYVARVELHGDHVDDHGFVVDYNDLAPFSAWLDDTLDHRCLNDWMRQPTAEHLARALHSEVTTRLNLPGRVGCAVGVSETPKTWAWWIP